MLCFIGRYPSGQFIQIQSVLVLFTLLICASNAEFLPQLSRTMQCQRAAFHVTAKRTVSAAGTARDAHGKTGVRVLLIPIGAMDLD